MRGRLVFLVLLGLGPAKVLAHSSLEQTDPKNGASLQQAPNEIRIWFSEPLKGPLSSVEVRASAARQIHHDAGLLVASHTRLRGGFEPLRQGKSTHAERANLQKIAT